MLKRALSLVPRLALPVLAGLSFSAAACVETGSGSDDVTDIANSKVKRQSIGNCWVYASVGWAESLHLGYSGEELNLSESYVTYWHWFEQINNGANGEPQLAYLDNDQLGTGGFWGIAAELMRRYGVVEEGRFIPEEAEEARSARQSAALSAINTSLKSGVLADKNKRRDPAVVRAELDKAWQLNSDVVAMLDAAFGKDVKQNLYDNITLPAGMLAPKDITVSKKDATVLTLADAIGKPSSSYDARKRKGTYAWNETSYPTYESGRRDFLRSAQKAMHAGLPVIMTWFVDFNAMKNNQFLAPPETPGRQGGHMTVLEDYEIENVPGFGTLKAGETITDPKALEAALATEAKIVFFRIKNSWGSDLAPPNADASLKGYNDLYMKYLNGPIKKCSGTDCKTTTNETGLWAFVLPPAAFPAVAKAPDPAPSCGDPCAASAAKNATSCGECVAKVCAADSYCCDSSKGSWDDQCISEAANLCSLTCN